MALRPLLLAAVVGIAALGAFHSPAAQAQSYFSISIGHPPPPRYERVIVRPGYAWVPGRWMNDGRRHVWRGGHHVRDVRVRPGYAYSAPRAYNRPAQAYRQVHRAQPAYRAGPQWRQPQPRARVQHRRGW